MLTIAYAAMAFITMSILLAAAWLLAACAAAADISTGLDEQPFTSSSNLATVRRNA